MVYDKDATLLLRALSFYYAEPACIVLEKILLISATGCNY